MRGRKERVSEWASGRVAMRTAGGLREDRVVGALTVEDHLFRVRVPHDDRHALPRRVERERVQHLRAVKSKHDVL